MALSAVDVVGPAFERMTKQLFKPFRLEQWLRLALTGLLAGEMGSAGGCRGNFPFNLPRRGQGLPPNVFGGHGLILVLAIGIFILLGIALGIALLYISSRMRFVLFDSVVAGECRIRDFWSRRGEPALRYFFWQILLTVAAVGSFMVIIIVPLAVAFSLKLLPNPREHVAALVLCGVVIVLLLLADTIALVLIHVLTKDFVVPQMALDNTTLLEGWRRLGPMMKQDKGGYAGYIGMKLVLSIAAAILLGIVTLIALAIVFLPVGGVGVLAVLWARNAGMTWNLGTIAIAIAAGVVAVAVILFIVGIISVPAIVFFPAYSMQFFAERYPALRAVLSPQQTGI